MFFGPFTDRRGRRTALLLGAGLTLAGSAVADLADNIGLIIVGRAIQGFGARSGLVVSRAIVRDNYGAEGSPKAMALLFALMAASFLTTPLLGGALLDLCGLARRLRFCRGGCGDLAGVDDRHPAGNKPAGDGLDDSCSRNAILAT